jgi:RHS repeat-associated protein
VTKYYLFGGQRVAMRRGGAVSFLHGDHLGSVSMSTDASGQVLSQARYTPFGDVAWEGGQAQTDFGFTGQRAERGLGLMDYGARWYDARLGRFLSPDTITPGMDNPMAWDKYAYVLNSPLKYSDPSGHIPCGAPHVAPGDCSNGSGNKITGKILHRPEAIDDFKDVKDDPVELIARAILSEQGGKIGTDKEADAIGVAWAIRNRHDSGYYATAGEGGLADKDLSGGYNWYWSAVSGVSGMQTDRAHDPMNNYGNWGSEQAMIEAYSRAREIAWEVLLADPSDDITNGAIRWSDAAYPSNGEPAEWEKVTMGDGGTAFVCTNCTPYERTHFDDDYNTYNGNWCVNTVPVPKCK